MSLEAVIAKLESLVRSAQFEEARHELSRIKFNRVERKFLINFANIANRVGSPLIALRILNPIIRGHRPKDARPHELIQYAHALRRVGAADEALEILEQVDEGRFPEAILQKANCHSTRWRYKEAADLLRRFLERVPPHEYSSKVARINLLAASIFLNAEFEVEKLIQELKQHLSQETTLLLFGNYLELASSWKIQRGSYDEALLLLDKAREFLAKAQGTWDELMVEKGIAVARSAQAGRVLPELYQIKERAISTGQWEVYRDCVFHIAAITRDSRLFEELYFGTPYESYRSRIVSSLAQYGMPADFTKREVVRWPLNASGSSVFSLVDGSLNGQSLGLKIGQTLHRCLLILASDFFRPFPIASLFSLLHPDEHFDPVHSPNRVHQVVTRARSWIVARDLPLAIDETGGSYRLRLVSDSFSHLIPRQLTELEAQALQLERAAKVFAAEFSTQDMKGLMQNSLASARRLLHWGVQSGRLEISGQGKNRKYRFVA